MIIIPGLVFVYVIYRMINKNQKYVLNDIFWTISLWSLMFINYYTCGIEYKEHVSVYVILYIVLCISMYIIAHIGSSKINFKFRESKYYLDKHFNTIPISLAVILGAFIYIVNIIANNNVIIGITRTYDTSIISTLSLLLADFAPFVWYYELIYSLMYGMKIPKHAFITILAYCFIPIFYAGRGVYVSILWNTVLIIFYFRRDKISKAIGRIKNTIKSLGIFMIFAIILVIGYSVFIGHSRYGSDYVHHFEVVANCEVSNSTMQILSYFGIFALPLLNAMFYFSSAIVKVGMIFNYYSGPYLHGFYQLNYISRRFPELYSQYEKVSSQIIQIMVEHRCPLFYSAFDTGIGMSIYDFGRIGTVFVLFTAGWLAGRNYRHYLIHRTSYFVFFQVIICEMVMTSTQLSPLYDNTRAYPVFISLMMCFIVMFLNRCSHKTL